MNTKNNQRFQDNDEKIQQSFIELLNTKDINQITVRTICENVNINRSTFYTHYKDVYDLLDKLQVTMNQRIVAQFEGTELEETFFMTDKFFIPFLEYISNNQSFYRACLYKRTSFPINEGFEPLWEKIVKPNCLKRGVTSKEEMMYYFVYFQAGITMVLKRWVDSGCKETPQQIWAYLKNCIHKIS